MSEKKKKTVMDNPPSVTGEPSGVPFNIPNTTFNVPVTMTTPTTVPPVKPVTVTGRITNKPALDQIEKVKKFLASRLHGPWTPEMLSQADKMLDELKQYV